MERGWEGRRSAPLPRRARELPRCNRPRSCQWHLLKCRPRYIGQIRARSLVLAANGAESALSEPYAHNHPAAPSAAPQHPLALSSYLPNHLPRLTAGRPRHSRSPQQLVVRCCDVSEGAALHPHTLPTPSSTARPIFGQVRPLIQTNATTYHSPLTTHHSPLTTCHALTMHCIL